MVTAQPVALSRITKNENDALQAFIQRLLTELGEQAQQVILFGSKARGDSAPDSDIDVLILADDENRQVRETISKISSQIGLDYDICLAVLLIANNHWRQMSIERFSLCRNVERDGIALFRNKKIEIPTSGYNKGGNLGNNHLNSRLFINLPSNRTI
jgi:predicted nucleotidyltransferase